MLNDEAFICPHIQCIEDEWTEAPQWSKSSYQVDVTEFVQPEVVDGGRDGWEVVSLEAGITQTDSSTQSRQNPPV